MKVLGGAVALGTAITIPFVIHDIISRNKGKGMVGDGEGRLEIDEIEIECEAEKKRQPKKVPGTEEDLPYVKEL